MEEINDEDIPIIEEDKYQGKHLINEEFLADPEGYRKEIERSRQEGEKSKNYFTESYIKKEKNPGKIFGKIGQAEAFIEKQPIFYSPEGLFWFWNFERFCYEMKDETDLLNGIREQMSVDTTNGKERAEIISALKQVGRKQILKDKPRGWIQFLNVLVNPKTLERFEVTHEYFLTNPIPHKLGQSEETPELDKLLHEWAIKDGGQDESYVQSLYEYIAYSLTDDLFMQRIIALTGGGSNGKGTFLKVIDGLVGENNRTSISLKNLATNNFATSAIYKKLVAFAGEVAYDDLKNTNVLKLLTGEDPIRYEYKGKTAFTDQSITTILIATNSLPTTPDRSLGFYRRWSITDFPNIFDVKNNVLSIITEQEYENLCLKCVSVLKGLYESCKFTNEGNYEERERKYEERSNPLPTFLDENYEELPGTMTKLRDLGNEFNVWLKDRRLRQMNIIQVGQQLRNLGYTVGKRKQGDDSFVAVINLIPKTKTT